MRKSIFLLLLMFCYSAYGQSLSVFDIDTTAFPVMKAKFYALDADGKQIKSLVPADFKLTENGIERTVLSVTCPPDKPAQRLSSVIVIDVSGSMDGTPLDIAKMAGKTWVNALPLGQSDCSVTSFDNGNYFNQDFTTNRNKLLTAVDAVGHGGGTDYNMALIEPLAGGILVVKTAKHKKVIIFITDGQPNQNPDESRIIAEAKANGITIHCITINLSAHQSMKNFADQTGGLWFENVKTEDEAKDIANKILTRSLYRDNPCEISWQSDYACLSELRNVQTLITKLNLSDNITYKIPYNGIRYLLINPSSIGFRNQPIGIQKDTTITITGINGDFVISDIIPSNPQYSITPKSFSLKSGETKNLALSYTPQDSNYNYCKFEILSNICNSVFYTSSFYTKQISTKKTSLKLTHPNGGESFVVGSDTVITWDGISPSDTVSLVLSIDSGNVWKQISNKATGLKYNWKNIPKPASNKCLVKASLEQFIQQNDLRTIGFGQINQVAYNPDGSRLLICGGGGINLIDLSSGNVILSIADSTNYVYSVAFIPDGTKIVSGCSDNTIKLWDVNTGRLLRTFYGHTDKVTSVAYSPDGTKIVSGSWDGTLKLWDEKTGILIQTFSRHTNYVISVAYSPDGTKIASGSWDGTLKLWDVNTGGLIRTFSGHANHVFSVAYSPDGTKIASGSGDNTLKLWDVNTGNVIETFIGHKNYVYSISFSPDGTKIVSGSGDKTIKLWDIYSVSLIQTFLRHTKGVISVAFTPDGSKIASGGFDNEVKIWNENTGLLISSFLGHTSSVYSSVISPDGSRIASGSGDKTIKLWDINTCKLIQTFSGHTNLVNSVAYSPDGNKIASGSEDNTVNLWDVNTGSLINTFSGHTDYIISVVFSPDGTKIVSGGWDGTVKLWDVNTGSLIRTFVGHKSYVNSVVFNPDGTKIASGSGDKTVKIWDLNTGSLIRNFPSHTREVYSVAYSPDGTKIASGSVDGTFMLWDENTGSLINTFFGQTGIVYSISFSPDGTQIASGNSDKTIKLWDENTGSLIRTIHGHTEGVASVAYSPDGTKIVSGSWDGTIRIWSTKIVTFGKSLFEDQSDTLFSIVAPQITSHDLDLGKVLLGSYKDSLITAFIRNTGSYDCKIKDIKLSGNDASDFYVISNRTFSLKPGQTQAIEFHFKPGALGKRDAIVEIESQDTTLIQNITGEGVQPQIQLLSKLVDFGIVEAGEQKDTLVFLIKNLDISPIIITDTKQLGPDMKQFEIISGGGGFTLNPGESRELKLSFKPIYIGRTSSELAFYFNGIGSPARSQLYGQGIGGKVYCTNDSGYPGDKKTIYMNLAGVKLNSLKKLASNFRAKLQFQKTILFPTDNSIIKSYSDDSTMIEISGSLGSDSVLSPIELIAALGNTDKTSIDITEFKWVDENGDEIDYETETESGSFKVLGICKEGGARLFSPNGNAQLMMVKPNPGSEKLEIEVNLAEKEAAELYISNLLGERVLTLLDGKHEMGKSTFNVGTNDLPAGAYYITIKTATQIETKILQIVK